MTEDRAQRLDAASIGAMASKLPPDHLVPGTTLT
jgi:hypothetical protein